MKPWKLLRQREEAGTKQMYTYMRAVGMKFKCSAGFVSLAVAPALGLAKKLPNQTKKFISMKLNVVIIPSPFLELCSGGGVRDGDGGELRG